MKDKTIYKIGDKLFQVNTRILEYTVIEIQTMTTIDHEQIFYILRCESCNDHDSCIISTTINDYGDLQYSHMVNNYDEEDEEYFIKNNHYRNGQYYWHKNENQVFYRTRKEAKESILRANIEYFKKEIEKHNDSIKKLEDNINKAQDDLLILKSTE